MKYDVTIIGGGHAGLEAAFASAELGLDVLILTMPGIGIASAPCNPAVGGVGKGQVVREIDALGGVMGKLADRSAIQYRILNESKGYAVQSTRVQIDKEIYSREAEQLVADKSNITVVREPVSTVAKVDELFKITTSAGSVFESKKVVVTTGTFLNGRMHTGEEQSEGGRVGCLKSGALSDVFAGVTALSKRFKTGTPARIKRQTIDFSKMEEQESDSRTPNFHFDHDIFKRHVEQVSCHLTKTNEKTLSIIRANKERSPIFNGQIQGVGPRYCPSIEDKAYRYLDKDVHHVFVEPESLELDTFYPNGVSTSLPKEVQLEFLRTIEGLENCEIAIYGYAVEYDVVDTTKLDITLQSQEVPGLYFAGQVNGTSGYEEAAGQGLIAGVNAGLSVLGKMPLVLDREVSYIGVMVEDLVSNKRDEPYRLFTARSENRLFVREDNVYLRMYQFRKQLGLNTALDTYLDQFIDMYEVLFELAKTFTYKANPKNIEYFKENNYGPLNTNINLAELAKRAHLDPVEVLNKEFTANGLLIDSRIINCVAISIKYEGYIQRSDLENSKLNKLEKKRVDWEKIANSTNVSYECKQRVKEIRPETFGQLQRIVGIRPATLAYVAGNLI
ncbi:tRNA uridine-5-carboxymethylaminomethyl(34) synthesis enzyme MnmG [Bacteriovorax sp. Seq25_V]|uniref:tRNA uridine-5-carboxymethylaminomethyl(34) synthesis enzyme MnmG n=1 Tax=Bacteriovorax sp. Seq25_V TaxID=1201288 RepID=UPI00038A00B5|nr:tRNA uridine-5-carboxymethylaminomethyl(34) synthesis enzyme MnmG [Bacteriovorax sp. Seq25_V]EQC43588.1 tRNA uridine 5-carboxymethylaminomethyl modification enzyme GidA [Bacteriovorax sp. Seq25_V]